MQQPPIDALQHTAGTALSGCRGKDRCRHQDCATVCYMDSVTHREMRNNSGDILRRVEAGESLQVTNNGRPAALIIPVGGGVLDGLLARGEARPAVAPLTTLSKIVRAKSPVSARELLEDTRGIS